MSSSASLNAANETLNAPTTVAVIGAGISGVVTAAHLLKHGVRVTVFERLDRAAGVWHLDDRIPDDPDYPSETPSTGDYQATAPGQFAWGTPPPDPADMLAKPHKLSTGDDDALEVSFAPPTPCYQTLMTNVPTTLMVSSLAPWPEGTPQYIRHGEVKKYIQGVSFDHGVDDITQYNTRVEQVVKSPDGKTWIIRTLTLAARGAKPHRLAENVWQFDAVVVATGHYSLPRVPNTPGLAEWKARFGARVMHSKQYRSAEPMQDKNVFVMGCGVSSLNICQELDKVASKVYQSSRGGVYDVSDIFLGASTRRVGGVQRFELAADPSPPDDAAPIPGRIILESGEAIQDIHQLVVATGYITSYPFLADLHEDDKPAHEAGPRTLVTADGSMTHNLHRDIFYIEDPTLAFVGVPHHNATFSLFDFQAQAVARVLSGKARLPTREAMRSEYERRIGEMGLGRAFHSLRDEGREEQYVRDLIDWVNQGTQTNGVQPMRGHSEKWLEDRGTHRRTIQAILNGEPGFKWPGTS